MLRSILRAILKHKQTSLLTDDNFVKGCFNSNTGGPDWLRTVSIPQKIQTSSSSGTSFGHLRQFISLDTSQTYPVLQIEISHCTPPPNPFVFTILRHRCNASYSWRFAKHFSQFSREMYSDHCEAHCNSCSSIRCVSDRRRRCLNEA